MAPDDYQALKASIEDIGVQNPITLYEGMVIDGWHRYSAASDLMMDCPSVELGDVDPRAFVLAQNKTRRHATQAQMALATAAVYQWTPAGTNQHTKKRQGTQCPPSNFDARQGTQCPPSKTANELAAAAGVGVRTIKQAKVVQARAIPEVAQAVRDGKLGLAKASAIARLPKEDQAAAIDKPLPKSGKSASVAAESSPHSTLDELVDELQAENLRLASEIAALSEADDQKAETLKWHRMYDHAMRRQSEAEQSASRHQKESKRLALQVRECCRALGLNDPRRLVPEVKKLASRQEAA